MSALNGSPNKDGGYDLLLNLSHRLSLQQTDDSILRAMREETTAAVDMTTGSATPLIPNTAL